MDSIIHPQAAKLQALIRAATASRPVAERGLIFCSRPGLALVNAAFDLFECDGLYDITVDVAREIGLERDGLADRGERIAARRALS
jgi:hypothetical protein